MRLVKAMLSVLVLVTAACSAGGGTGVTSGPASGGSSGGGEAVTSDSTATVANTSDAGTGEPSTTVTSVSAAAATGSNTSATTATDAATASTVTTDASATGTESASDGSSTSTGAVTSGTTGSSTGDAPLSFAADIFPLWQMVREPAWEYRGSGSYSGCNVDGVCHGGVRAGAGLIMADAPSTYAELIDVPSASTLCAGTLRVVAGDPAASCLVLFYQGRLGNDDLGWVDDAEIELMREWIRQGALP